MNVGTFIPLMNAHKHLIYKDIELKLRDGWVDNKFVKPMLSTRHQLFAITFIFISVSLLHNMLKREGNTHP